MLTISARKVSLVDMSIGGPHRERDYDWVAWDSNIPGTVAATLSGAVGSFVRQQLQFADWEWHPKMSKTKKKLLKLFPLENASNDSYVTKLGEFCLKQGREIGVTICVLEPKTNWGFHHAEELDFV